MIKEQDRYQFAQVDAEDGDLANAESHLVLYYESLAQLARNMAHAGEDSNELRAVMNTLGTVRHDKNLILAAMASVMGRLHMRTGPGTVLFPYRDALADNPEPLTVLFSDHAQRSDSPDEIVESSQPPLCRSTPPASPALGAQEIPEMAADDDFDMSCVEVIIDGE